MEEIIMKKKVLSAVLACAATMALTTCAFADAPATVGDSEKPGSTDKTVVAKVEVGEITDAGLAGTALDAKLFTGDAEGKSWADVVSVTFTSDEAFAVGFKVKAGAVEGNAEADWCQMGVDELAKADLPAEALATEWALGEAEVKAIVDGGSYVELKTADGKTATVTATITLKEKAPVTGIALAIAPAGLAVAFVTVAAVMSKKKKG